MRILVLVRASIANVCFVSFFSRALSLYSRACAHTHSLSHTYTFVYTHSHTHTHQQQSQPDDGAAPPDPPWKYNQAFQIKLKITNTLCEQMPFLMPLDVNKNEAEILLEKNVEIMHSMVSPLYAKKHVKITRLFLNRSLSMTHFFFACRGEKKAGGLLTTACKKNVSRSPGSF